MLRFEVLYFVYRPVAVIFLIGRGAEDETQAPPRNARNGLEWKRGLALAKARG